ncbi:MULTISPECIES: LysR substrate-binding domain-containing protein [Acinetobacter]|uniref:LysR substrate-binding domain-containing protein n=1 Tax=Acinetobacter TaxID=469 RepID=UPI0004D3CAF1|nr:MULTISPECIES: LysR substrate-binding domain-containing protein [Acinetobacter]MRT37388.1 LysR family transcriptional regulator [Acinetobacter sp. RIT698]KEC85806.1 LysR family transcriptional regulator [Acinetobacter sp. ETR1]MBP2546424.1 DNA-binding transcriptional LysR family regulator [Acinetobacter guillouiae]MCS4298877.1 DNA-binding transcriptional LysR family regulator [Acinetobacter guillouiae]MCW2252385.1 DNA-binding transcriptional LysR family regulator [Acinetobacter sp. BIGb0204]
MHSFDDYYYFYLVVKHGGFSAASEASNITKSKLSRRILDLEAKFNVTLIQRSTRHFKVTPLGQEFFEECAKIIEQADNAQNVLLKQEIELQGLIKISCPPVMMEHQIRPILNQFLKKYPKVRVELALTSRRIDVLHDDIDLAIRTNFSSNEDSSIIVRDVIKTTHCLVISPELLGDREIQHVTELCEFPTIVLGTDKQHYHWHLHHIQQREEIDIPLQPRVKSNDLMGAYYAVLDGLGIADLPYLTVERDIASGRLIHLLPEWCSNIGVVQLVYASRKGQRLVMEKLIEDLVEGIRAYAPKHDGYIL